MGATNSPSSTCEKLSKRAIRSARSCPTTRPSPGCANCRNSRNCWPWSRVFSNCPRRVAFQAGMTRFKGAFSPALLFALLFTSCIRQPAGAPAERLAVLRLENLSGEASRTFKATKVIGVSAPAGDVLGAGAALARDVSSRAVPYGTRNPQALEAYVRALEGSDVTVMEVGLGVAIAADPDFVSPYRLLAQIKAQRQDRSGAVATLDQALARGNAIPELERARLALESAELTGNPDARLSVLSQLV